VCPTFETPLTPGPECLLRWPSRAGPESRGDAVFRTWHATVLAAVPVPSQALRTKTACKRSTSRATAEVAHHLGNTAAVARRSYIDPRVIDRFSSGVTISVATMLVDDAFGADTRAQTAVEHAVIDPLRGDLDSPVVDQIS
jgi:hypothetical protein